MLTRALSPPSGGRPSGGWAASRPRRPAGRSRPPAASCPAAPRTAGPRAARHLRHRPRVPGQQDRVEDVRRGEGGAARRGQALDDAVGDRRASRPIRRTACGPGRGCSGPRPSWLIAPPLTRGGAGIGLDEDPARGEEGAVGRRRERRASPAAAVPGSMVHAVMRTVSNEPRSTMSQPETVRPSRTSRASPPPVKTHGGARPSRRPQDRAHARPGPDEQRDDRVRRRARRPPAPGRWRVGSGSPSVMVPAARPRPAPRRGPCPPVTTLLRCRRPPGIAEQAAVVGAGADHRGEPVVVARP